MLLFIFSNNQASWQIDVCGVLSQGPNYQYVV